MNNTRVNNIEIVKLAVQTGACKFQDAKAIGKEEGHHEIVDYLTCQEEALLLHACRHESTRQVQVWESMRLRERERERERDRQREREREREREEICRGRKFLTL